MSDDPTGYHSHQILARRQDDCRYLRPIAPLGHKGHRKRLHKYSKQNGECTRLGLFRAAHFWIRRYALVAFLVHLVHETEDGEMCKNKSIPMTSQNGQIFFTILFYFWQRKNERKNKKRKRNWKLKWPRCCSRSPPLFNRYLNCSRTTFNRMEGKVERASKMRVGHWHWQRDSNIYKSSSTT